MYQSSFKEKMHIKWLLNFCILTALIFCISCTVSVETANAPQMNDFDWQKGALTPICISNKSNALTTQKQTIAFYEQPSLFL